MKTDKFSYGSIRCEVRCASQNPDAVCVVLYPPIAPDWIEQAVRDFNCAIAVVQVPDWDNNLSPWPAQGQPPGSPDFQGHADVFAKILVHDLMPRIMQRIKGVTPSRLILTGVSMSGMFGLWLWMQNSYFTDLISISGSFWFDGFTRWLRQQNIPHRSGKAFFSLGDKESRTSVKAFKTVGADTKIVVDTLKQAGIDAVFQPSVGTHYAPIYPRLKSAFESMNLK